MIEKNQHKFQVKDTICVEELLPHDAYNQELSLNFSRSMGDSKNWIGCGYLNKTGVEIDHMGVQFPFYSLVYVYQGEGRYIDDSGKEYALAPGSVFQRQPFVTHTTLINPEKAWKEYYLDCDEELYEHLCAISLINKDTPVYDSQQVDSMPKRFEALMQQLQQGSEEEVLDAYLGYLNTVRALFAKQQQQPATNDMVKQSLGDFDARYAMRFDLKEYCREKGWGYEKFRKVFKKHMGISPRDYLIRKRMDEACRLLRASHLRISEISAKLGYASQYEFSNQFHRFFNVSPKHYREGV